MQVVPTAQVDSKTTLIGVAVMERPGALPLRGHAEDLSAHGIFVVLPRVLQVGTQVELTIDLMGDVGIPRAPVLLRGTVVNLVTGVGVGIRFDDPSPEVTAQLDECVRQLRSAAQEPR